MGTKKIEQKAYIRSFEYEQSRGGPANVKVEMSGYVGPVTVSCPMDYGATLAMKRAYDKRLEVKITLEIEQSSLDEARDLLATGDNKGAIGKALDIIERLDK